MRYSGYPIQWLKICHKKKIVKIEIVMVIKSHPIYHGLRRDNIGPIFSLQYKSASLTLRCLCIRQSFNILDAIIHVLMYQMLYLALSVLGRDITSMRHLLRSPYVAALLFSLSLCLLWKFCYSFCIIPTSVSLFCAPTSIFLATVCARPTSILRT